MLGSRATIQELLQRETEWWNVINTVSNQSNADVTKESENNGDSTPGYDTNEDESFYIQDFQTR